MSLLKSTSRVLTASFVGFFIAATSLASASAASPTKPYFKVFGGSVFAGGGFSPAGSTSCPLGSSNYQIADPSGGATNGGILGFVRLIGGKYYGASTQYDAYATGPVDGSAADYGFATQSNQKQALTFANIWTTQWGGYFDADQPQSDCIPDYFDNQKTIASADLSGTVSASQADGQHLSNGNLTISGGGINAGNKITIFVNGDAYINGDITYGNYTDSSVPKFALVVRGNIYISNNVHQLDGLYISQPLNPSDTSKGVIWTCYKTDSPGIDQTAPWTNWVVNNCNSKLTFNGAVVARQVNLMRTQGDSATANSPEDTLDKKPYTNPNYAYNTDNIAELFNYNPGIIFVGGGFFNQSPPTYHIDSLVSLPPVF